MRNSVREFANEFSSGGKLQAKLIDHSREVKVLDKIKTIEEKVNDRGEKIEDDDDDGEEVSKVDTNEQELDPDSAARMKELEAMLSGDAKDVSKSDLKRLLRETKESLKDGDDEERKILEELESKLEDLKEDESDKSSNIEALMSGMAGGDISTGDLKKLIEETRSSLGDTEADRKVLAELESKLGELEAEESKS